MPLYVLMFFVAEGRAVCPLKTCQKGDHCPTLFVQMGLAVFSDIACVSSFSADELAIKNSKIIVWVC